MLVLIYLNLHLHLYLHLLKNRLIGLCSKGLTGVAMATVTNWPFGTVSGHILTTYMTTGPVSASHFTALVLPGSKKVRVSL